MRRALLSVSDKEGLIPFARELVGLGFELVSTGGTAKALEAAGLPVTLVSDVTGFPEIMDGRVKTLHPKIHGGLLARLDQPKHLLAMIEHGFKPFHLVCCNLYPFEQTVLGGCTVEEAVEQIDIGGPSMVRSAAKNHAYLYVVTNPTQYERVLQALRDNPVGEVDRTLSEELATEAFALTEHYDGAIRAYFEAGQGKKSFSLTGRNGTPLRYGENPHQWGMWYPTDPTRPNFLGGEVVHGGKGCSYVNVLDMDAAYRTALSFEEPTVCINKHASPSGVASSTALQVAFLQAYACDPLSAFGGVIGVNRPVDIGTVEAINRCAPDRKPLFVECIVAPGYEPDALALLKKKENIRLLQVPPDRMPDIEVRSVLGGVLVMQADHGDPEGTEWKVLSKREPTAAEWESMRFGWKACRPVLSNAIVLAQGTATVGIGGGQPNRIDCVRIAIERAKKNAKGSVMASDSFFPYDDCVKTAAVAGITAVIFQGGGKQDPAVIAAADEANMALVMTGVRHFRH